MDGSGGREGGPEKELGKEKIEITEFFLSLMVGWTKHDSYSVPYACFPLISPFSSSAPFLVWWHTLFFSLPMPSRKRKRKRKREKELQPVKTTPPDPTTDRHGSPISTVRPDENYKVSKRRQEEFQ